MHFVNIHTHKESDLQFALINIFPEDAQKIEKNKYYSIGIHPWEVTNVDIDKQLNIVKELAGRKNVIAVGEIGLDKLRENFDLQKEVFLKQINIAKEHKKPIIVHCVKAFSELLEILKGEMLNIPIIIHRYSGNKTIADQLIKFGCFLSFGHELFNYKSKVQRVFKSTPLEHIFLETDDAEIDIKDVYQKASEIKAIKLDMIQDVVFNNFKRCFKFS